MLDIRAFALTKFTRSHNITDSKTIKKIAKLLDMLDISASSLFVKDGDVYAFDGLSTWDISLNINMFIEPARKNPIEDMRQLEFFKKQAHKQWLRKWAHPDPAIYEKRVSLEKRRIAGVRKRIVISGR